MALYPPKERVFLWGIVMSSVGARIKQARELRGIGQNELDRLIGASAGATNRVEKGERGKRRGLGVAAIEKYASALRVRAAWLLDESGPMDLSTDMPNRAAAIEIARAGGTISEHAIAMVIALDVADATRSTLWWIEVIGLADAAFRHGLSLSPPKNSRLPA